MKDYKTIDEAICDYLDKGCRRTTKARGNGYWGASSLGYCKRYQVLQRAGVLTSGDTNYAWRNAAEDGHMGHAWRQHALHTLGIMNGMEGEIIYEPLRYRGHYDLIVTLGGKMILGDIKTQNNRAFRARSRMPGRIDPKHKRQVGSYFHFAKKTKFPDLYASRLYYVNKNTGEREEFELYFESDYFKDIENELVVLNEHWDNGLLPKKEVDHFCKICPFFGLCRDMLNRKNTKIKDAIQRSIQARA